MSTESIYSLLELAKANHLSALDRLEKIANHGYQNAEALNALGLCYEYGYSVPENRLKAIEYYRIAASYGYDIAMCNLGLALESWKCIQNDLGEAIDWYYQSALCNTSNENGSSRSVQNLIRIYRTQNHRSAGLYVAHCLERGYGIKRNFEQASAIYAELGVRDFSQYNIRWKFGIYLKSKNRDPRFIKIFENNGHCAGLTMLYLYARWLTQKSQSKDDSISATRDDLVWLLSVLNRILDWDGKSPLSEEDEFHFDRVVSLIVSMQSAWYCLPIKNAVYEKLADTLGRTIRLEYSLAAVFTLQDLESTLSKLVSDTKLVTFYSYDHVVGFVKFGSLFFYIDPDCPFGAVEVANIKQVSELILKSCRYAIAKLSPISITIYDVGERKVNEERQVAYPSPRAIFESLSVNNSQWIVISNSYAKGVTALHTASWIGCADSVNYLIERYNDQRFVNKMTTEGNTALMYASGNGQTHLLIPLINAGADPNMRNNYHYSAIVMASEHGFTEAALILAKHGANQMGLALMRAACEGHEETVKKLLEVNAPVNYIDGEGWTPLQYAYNRGYLAVVRILLEHGASLQPDRTHHRFQSHRLGSQNTSLAKFIIDYKLDSYEQSLFRRKEVYAPRTRFLPFLFRGYSKFTKFRGSRELREAVHEGRKISWKFRGALNNSKLGEITKEAKHYGLC